MDCHIYVFAKNAAGKWAAAGKLAGEVKNRESGNSVSAAMQRFQLEASTGQASAVVRLDSKHQNTVSDLRVLKMGKDWKVSSCGYDGQILFWGPKDVEAA
eukprot:NODE_5667_length_495_cov_124.641256_g4234_i0.p2 GENE.NODE_5667_length_495_cov_124.641256_g4234_i0~~NODE_5667_length_495_cov_124.641256_g4234_i0.p2  ORF type:complete len:117 (-),score=61.22 NODE_5667_length_495_cov_124.641256_g4234_i0:145-444(-)